MAPYNKALQIREAPPLTHYLNPNTDRAAIEAKDFSKKPEVVHFDNTLSVSALTGLRTFRLEAAVPKTDYANRHIDALSPTALSA
jgi:hypothetical protein